MRWPSKRNSPAISNAHPDWLAIDQRLVILEGENAALRERLAMAESTLECQAIEHAEIKPMLTAAMGGDVFASVAALVEIAKRIERLESIDLTPFISAITDTGADQSELAAKVETLLANQKALGDRLTIQTAIISNAELGVAALRDTDQLARETLGSVRQEWSARCDRLLALENTFARFRTERDTRFRDAARILSGEVVVVSGGPPFEAPGFIGRPPSRVPITDGMDGESKE